MGTFGKSKLGPIHVRDKHHEQMKFISTVNVDKTIVFSQARVEEIF